LAHVITLALLLLTSTDELLADFTSFFGALNDLDLAIKNCLNEDDE
jgi:hypothetical protein